MRKIATFFRRVLSGSFKRFFRNLELVHKQSGKSRIILFFDMVYCMFAYGVGYLDYLTFGFVYIKRDKRLTFMTMNDNLDMVHRLNEREAYDVFDNKLMFSEKFGKYFKRDFCNIQNGFDKFAAFCEGKEVFFVKKPVSFGGLGVKKIELENRDLKELYDELIKDGFFLAEEAITQHPQMNLLCANSVNTIRVCTILSDNGNANVVYALVRVGNGKTDVDNISSGGMYTLLSPEGEITHPLFCDKTVTYYERHPETGQEFIGFKMPYFNEALEMCREAAHVEPGMRYIGWDVAITPDGPVFVEGNNLPGYDMCQNHRFHDDGCGIKADFEKALKN